MIIQMSRALLVFNDVSIRLEGDRRDWRPWNWTIVKWLDRWLTYRREAEKARKEGLSPESFPRENFLGIERRRLAICRQDGSPADLERILPYLSNIHSEVVASDARLVMVIHPCQFQVEPALLKEISSAGGPASGRIDIDRPQRFLAEFCREKGISCFDLLGAFRRKGGQGGLFLPNNTPYNDTGNLLAAREIRDFLLRNSLLRTGISPAVHRNSPSAA